MPLNLVLPTVGQSKDVWGSILNAALSQVEAEVNDVISRQNFLESEDDRIEAKIDDLTPRVDEAEALGDRVTANETNIAGIQTAIAANPGIPRFASVAARDTAIPAPAAGQLAYTPTTGVFLYHGAHWTPLPGTLVFEGVAASAQTMTTPGPVAVNFGTNRFLPFGQTRTTNLDRYTPPWPGRYQVRAVVPLAVSATGGRSGLIYLNGTSGTSVVGAYDAYPASYGTFPILKMTGTVICNGTTDYVAATVSAAATNADTLYAGAAVATLSVIYLGPAYT